MQQVVESTDEEYRVGIVVQSSNDEDEFAVEYEPISFSDEERLVAIHGFDQGILNIEMSCTYVFPQRC